MQKEAKARIKINKLLEEAVWRFFDDENGKANIALEVNVKITTTLDKGRDWGVAFGEDFEKTLRIIGWQWSAAELPVRVDAVVRHYELMIQIHHGATQTGG